MCRAANDPRGVAGRSATAAIRPAADAPRPLGQRRSSGGPDGTTVRKRSSPGRSAVPGGCRSRGQTAARARRRMDSSSSAGRPGRRRGARPAARRALRTARAARRRRRCRRRPGRRRAGRRPPRRRCTRRRWRRRRSRVTLARSLTPRVRRWSTALRMFCSETPVSSSRLTTLSTRMSRKRVEPLGARAGGGADRRRDQAGAGPVVQLPVGDPGSGAGGRAAVADEVGVDLVVGGSTDCGVAEELTLGAVALVAHVSVLLVVRGPLARSGSTAARRPTDLRCHTVVVRRP